MSEKNTMNLSDEAQDFLWYSYFHKSYDELSKDYHKALKACAERAYLDLCRTLRFREKDESHTAFRAEVVNIIVKNIDDLISNRDEFDTKHNELCEEAVKAANSQSVLKDDFNYGQAQKLLNMTLKYMLLMNFWSDKLKTVSDILHVPVDSYIIESAAKYFKIKISSKAWSKWDKDEYVNFQEKIRTALAEKGSDEAPIKWESHAWIEVAQKRKRDKVESNK